MPPIERHALMAVGYRRADLVAFWALLAVLAALLAAAAGWHSGPAWRSLTLAVGGGLAVLAPGLLWPRWFETGVWIWNGCARRAAAILRAYVLWITYFTVIALTSRAGRVGPPAPNRGAIAATAAGWRRRGRPMPRGPHPEDDAVSGEQGLRAVAAVSGQSWLFALAPALFLLSMLREEQAADAVPGTSYTLY